MIKVVSYLDIGVEGIFDLDYMQYDGNILSVRTVEERKYLELQFDDALTFRLVDEGDAFRINAALADFGQYGKTIYQCDASELQDWLLGQSYGEKYQNIKLYNYLVVLQNHYIEIISHSTPKVTLMSR
jgi:hypothetical protein